MSDDACSVCGKQGFLVHQELEESEAGSMRHVDPNVCRFHLERRVIELNKREKALDEREARVDETIEERVEEGMIEFLLDKTLAAADRMSTKLDNLLNRLQGDHDAD